jgi:hypothetical protein
MTLFLVRQDWDDTKIGMLHYPIYVCDDMGQPVLSFDYMCSTIYTCGCQMLQTMLSDMEAIQNGDQEMGGGGSDAWGVDFDKNGAVFEFDYAPEGEEIGGEVSLAQFKLAVQTYLQFLEDPERKPITIVFPEK